MATSAPILVLAAPGAGGPTLASAIGQNPGAFGVPALNLELEASVYDLVLEMQGVRGAQIHGLLRVLAQCLGGEQSLHSVEMTRRWLINRLHLPSAEIAHWLIARLAPRRIVQPVGSGLFSETGRRRLAETYPDADLLIVTREPDSHDRTLMVQHDGAAAILLGAYTSEGAGTAIPDFDMLRDLTEQGMEQMLELLPASRALHLHLDNLLANPTEELRRVAGDLSLPADVAAVQRMLHPEASIIAGTGPYGAHGPSDVHPFHAFDRDAMVS